MIVIMALIKELMSSKLKVQVLYTLYKGLSLRLRCRSNSQGFRVPGPVIIVRAPKLGVT